MAIEEILDLEQLEVNIYRGKVFSPESGFLQRTFGGHVAGQSLVSAVRTIFLAITNPSQDINDGVFRPLEVITDPRSSNPPR